ncbi:MAG: hypothetical protein VYC34_12500 [Planctomycetota bacterium]|nr:hypothetical protein [Planctomycetota bacterium]
MRRTGRMMAVAVLGVFVTVGFVHAADWLKQVEERQVGSETRLLYDLDWPGGSADEYFKAVALELKGRVNLILDDSLASVEIQSIGVQRVTEHEVVTLPARLHQFIHIDWDTPAGENARLPGPAEVVPRTLIISAHLADEGGHDAQRFDLAFEGGTVAEYVAAVQAANPEANVVLMPGAGAFSAPPVELKGVTTEAALSVLQDQSRRVGDAMQALDVDDHFMEATGQSLYRIMVHGRAESAPTATVWSVEDILSGGVSTDDLLTGVQAALRLFEQPAKVQFHEETSLLLLRGPQEQLDVVERVLKEMRDGAATRSRQARERQLQMEELEVEQQSLRSQLEIARAEMAAFGQEMARLEVKDAPMDLMAAEIEMLRAKARVSDLEARLELVRRRLARLAEEAGSGDRGA